MNLEGLFVQFLEDHFPGTENGRILLAVSGGPDSMALLHLFAKLNKQIAVAHCNFALRGNESELDEIHVKNVCTQLGIPLYVKKFDTIAYKKQLALSTQVAARILRYTWFQELCEEHQFHFIATAHHQDDNVETVIQNILRGSGIKGLSGIPLHNGSIIRPLLFATKNQLIQYLHANSHTYRIDASNSENAYTRNTIRNLIIPQLSAINSNASVHIQNLSNHARFASAIIQEKINALTEQFVDQKQGSLAIHYEKISSFEFAELYLFELISGYGFNTSQCYSIHEAYLKGKTGSRFLTDNWELIISRKELILTLLESVPSSQTDIKIDTIPSTPILIRNNYYYFEVMNAIDVKEYHPGHLYINADLLSFPLRIRSWKDGDSFYPLGNSGSKKISDFLIDMKVSLADKRNICLLENYSGQPVAVLNYRIDNRFRIGKTTRSVLHIYQQKEESD